MKGMKKIRKASELNDLEELNLDSRMRTQIRQKMKREGWSLEDLVFFGRKIAFHTVYENGKKRFFSFDRLRSRELYDKLADALDAAGFIRHDIGDIKDTYNRVDKHIAMARRIFWTYKKINGLAYDYNPDSFDSYVCDPLVDNKHYETYAYSSYAQYYSLFGHILSQLEEAGSREKEILVFSLGFGTESYRGNGHYGKPRYKIAEELGLRDDYIQSIKCKVYDKLRRYCQSLLNSQTITNYITIESE